VRWDNAERVIAVLPDAEWRLLFALSRYGGLRCPSKHLGLRWCDIDLAGDRMTVRSPKTEHPEGNASRIRSRARSPRCGRRGDTKGNGTRKACLTMVYKLLQSAAKRWRLLNGSNYLPDVIAGVQFIDGVKPQVGRRLKTSGLQLTPERSVV
jgi:integrase